MKILRIALLGMTLAAPAVATVAETLPCRPADSTRPGIGLVLSGGGARGAAHVGVLRVLEELEIPIDCIAGTSMGAVVGGFYAAGWSPDEIERELLAIDWAELFRGEAPRRSLSFRRKEDDLRYIDFDAGLRGGRIKLPHGAAASSVLDFLLRSKTLNVAGIRDFDQLPIPFRALAADLTTGDEVVLDRGEISRAIRASMSIPGVFPPVEAGERVLVDGGVLNNLPVEAARAMGAEVILAVDVSTPLRRREELGSITGIAFQALSLASQRRVNEQKRDADILLEPDLGVIAMLDFPAMAAAIRNGEDAARGASSRLQPLADATAFAVRRARQRRAPQTPEPLRSITVAGTERVHERRLRDRVKSRAGAPLDLDRLRTDLGNVSEVGEFDRVDFELTRHEEGVDVAIRPHDNFWGPLYLRGGLNLSDDLEGHNAVNLLVNVTRTSLNAVGAEWRNEFQAGQTRRAFSEIYQPLWFREGWFAAASLEHRKEVSDVYADRRKIAEYAAESLVGGLDLGLHLGEYGEIRLGLRRGGAKAEPDVGSTDLPVLDVDAGGVKGRLVIDRVDHAGVPREGKYVLVEAFRSERALGSDLSYDKLSASYWRFNTVRRQTWFLALSGGTRFGGDLPAYDEFLLGGLFSLSGYRRGELRGQHYAVARSGYLFRLSELPELLGTGVYAGGWLEAGNVWQTSDTIGDSLIYTATVAAAADTRLGALYFAYGLADDGKGSFSLSLGQSF
jgi:NTE family protein